MYSEEKVLTREEKIFFEAFKRDPLMFEQFRCGEAIPAFHSNNDFVKLLRMGNQGGKTHSGARETAWVMTGTHPWKPCKQGPVHGRAVTYSWKQSITVQKRLNAVLPKFMIDGYDFNDRRGFVNQRIKLKNGSTLEIVTASQDNLAHASATLDFVWIDEPPPEELYSELLARLLVRKGKMWITMTPINRPVDWLIKEIERGKITDFRFDLTPENCPHLTQEQIDAIADAYLPHQKAQRLHGHWHGETTDRYFDAYDARCVSDEIPQGSMLNPVRFGLGIDHGEGVGKQVAILTAHVGPRVWVIDEYRNTKVSTPFDDAKGMLEMFERNGLQPWDIHMAVGDINSAGKAFSGLKVNQALENAFAQLTGRTRSPFRILNAFKKAGSIDWGNRIINYAFKRGDLTINPSCEYLNHALSHWQGKHDDLSHGLDAMRYIVHKILAHDESYYFLRMT